MGKEALSRGDSADPTAGPFVDMKMVDKKGWKRKRPAWVDREGFAFIGAWESITEYRRFGNGCHELESAWEFGRSEAFVKDVKRLGCNCIIGNFDFSFGRVAQKDDWQKTRKLIKLCHKHGLKVGTYFRLETVFRESLVGEEREILNYVQRDPWGRVQSEKGRHYWNLLCFHHPEARRYKEEMIRMAICELKTDIIHFDGFLFGGPEPYAACRCEKCKEDFRQFLRDRYGHQPEVLKKRIGFSTIDGIEPPYTYPNLTFPRAPVTDPLWQMWIEFRCHWTAKLARHFCRFIQKLNPDVAIEVNSSVAVRENVAGFEGVDIPTVFQYTDAHWCEDAYRPEILPSGELISRIRQFKMARRFDNVLFTYMEGPDDRSVLRNMAHAAAFNAGTVASLGFVPRMPWDYRLSYDAKRKFLGWLRKNRAYYQNTESAAEIAVWRSERSQAFGSDLVATGSMRMEQLLIEERMPFSIVFDEWLEKRGPERILILPNVECVTEPEAKAIERFVKDGGRLFIGQESGLYDGWRRRYDDFIFRKMMGPKAGRDVSVKTGIFMAIGPAGMVTGHEEKREGGKVFLEKYGKGRVAYVPEIIAPSECPPLITPEGEFDVALDYTHWRVPTKKEEVLTGLRWLIGEGLRLEVAAPRGVVAEYLFQRKQKRYLAHIINFLERNDAPVVQLKMRLKPRERVRGVRIISPDPDGPPKFKWKAEKSALSVEILKLDLYAVVIIET